MEKNELLALKRETAPSDWLPIEVALQTGMRIGDVVSLPRAALRDSVIEYTAKKTGKSGEATLSAPLAAAVRRNANRRWLFPSPRDASRHITRQAVYKRLKKAAARSGIDTRGVSPHSMRKVYAVRKAAADGIKAAQAALQHDRRETTEMYANSDWLTGSNAEKPLKRGDFVELLSRLREMIEE